MSLLKCGNLCVITMNKHLAVNGVALSITKGNPLAVISNNVRVKHMTEKDMRIHPTLLFEVCYPYSRLPVACLPLL
jgi:hypothetical protein